MGIERTALGLNLNKGVGKTKKESRRRPPQTRLNSAHKMLRHTGDSSRHRGDLRTKFKREGAKVVCEDDLKKGVGKIIGGPIFKGGL